MGHCQAHLVIALLGLLATSAIGARGITDRRLLEVARRMAIENGQDATGGRYPYFVSLRAAADSYHFCGGALFNYGTATAPGALTGKVILTAAHCFENGILGVNGDISNPVVFINPLFNIGGYDLNTFYGQFPPPNNNYQDATVMRTVYGTFVHKDYNFAGRAKVKAENDIALLLLDAQVGPPTIPAVRIPPAGTIHAAWPGGLAAGSNLRIVGMGMTNQIQQTFPAKLQQADVPLHPTTKCKADLPIANLPPSGAGDWGVNSRICHGAGSASNPKAPSTCTGDSGGPLLTAGADWKTDLQVALCSYGKLPREDDRGRTISLCNESPRVGTDLAYERAWIDEQMALFQATYFEYTIDIFLNDATVDKAFEITSPINKRAQTEVGKYLSKLIGKKPSGLSPYQVNFYSLKSSATTPKTTVLRYKYTSKKTYNQITSFFRTGSYKVPCVSGSTPDWSGGSSATATDCASGPFSPNAKSKGVFSFLYTSGKTSYFRETADNLANILTEYWNGAGGWNPFGDNKPEFSIPRIDITVGHEAPGCVKDGNGVNACKRSTTFWVPPPTQ